MPVHRVNWKKCQHFCSLLPDPQIYIKHLCLAISLIVQLTGPILLNRLVLEGIVEIKRVTSPSVVVTLRRGDVRVRYVRNTYK